MEKYKLRVPATNVVRALVLACTVVVAASTAGQLLKYWGGHPSVYGLVKKFYVDEEQNIPTMFSVSLLGFAALLLVFISILKTQERDPYTPRWKLLAWGFLYMALDEGAEIHEMFSQPFRQILGVRNLGVFYYGWVIPFGIIILILAAYFIKFVFSLPRRTGATFVIAAILYLGGAIGFELIGGKYGELHGEENMTYVLLATIEETLEMVGVVVFISALLKYIRLYHSAVHVYFAEIDLTNTKSESSTADAISDRH